MAYIRRVIHISAMDSPNVQLALMQRERGLPITGEEILPGVLSWEAYQVRRKTWDPIRQCIGLDGQFYEGAEVRLYPAEWLNKANQLARDLDVASIRAEAIGIDTAEGGDQTVWTVIGRRGIIRQISIKTPDTSVISGRTISLMREYNVKPDKVMFDQGGGGQEHADYLRQKGYRVETVSFGESVAPEPVRFMKPFDDKVDERREKFTYKNRRAQMYWMARLLLDPVNQPEPFAIPPEFTELRRQLEAMPLLWDEEGRVIMMPKQKRYNSAQNQETLFDRLGCSPDEADSFVLAVYAMDPGIQQRTLSPIY